MPLGGAADRIPAPAREQGNASARDWFRILRESGEGSFAIATRGAEPGRQAGARGRFSLPA